MLNLIEVDPGTVALRSATHADAGACADICYEAFRSIAAEHNFPADFPDPDAALGLFAEALDNPSAEVVLAEAAGRIVGSNILWTAGPVAGIGPITVAPQAQNLAIGRRLMDWVLARAAPPRCASVRLVQAAWHGRSMSLYTKLGFSAREPLSVLQGAPLSVEIAGKHVRPASDDDRTACNALCAAVHGHARAEEFDAACRAGRASVVLDGRELTGYTTGIGFFGHTVGRTNADLQALVGAATVFEGPGMLVPTRNAHLLRWCLEAGLRIVQPMTLMSRGLYNEPDGGWLPSIMF